MRALGAKLIPVPYEVAWKTLEERSFPGAEGTFIHPFDDHNFIAGHATMGLEILEDAPETAAVIASIGGGGLITGVASCNQGAQTGDKGPRVEPETAARPHFRSRGIAAGVQGMEGLFCRWGRRPKHVPSNVGTNETGSGRLHRRQSGGDQESDAAHGGKSASDFRRRRRVAGRGGIDWQSGPRSDRSDRLRR